MSLAGLQKDDLVPHIATMIVQSSRTRDLVVDE